MKKIVLAIFTLQGNGAERFALTLAQGLIDAGHEAHIVYFKNIIELPVANEIKLHFFDYQKFRAIPKFMRAKFAAKAFDKFVLQNIGEADLVLSNLFPVDFILSRSQLKNVHLVIHNTTSIEYAKQLNRSGYLEKLKQVYLAKPCVGVSEGVSLDFKHLFGQSAQIQTILNPINTQQIEYDAEAFVPEYKDYIVHVGKFKQQKRHDILINAYAQANIKEKLLLVGTGELMTDAKQQVKQLGLEEKVIFIGFQKNPYPYIKHANFMVFSSDFEGLGLVILESIVLKTPVISTDCPSGPNEILDKENLVAVGNVDELAEKIQQGNRCPQNFITVLKPEFSLTYAINQYLNL